MRIYIKGEGSEGIGVLVFGEKNKTLNKWYGDSLSKYKGLTMRGTALLETGFKELDSNKFDGRSSYLDYRLVEHFYKELFFTSKKNRIKYFYAYVKPYLMANIKAELGVKILLKGIDGLEHMISYRMVGFRHNDRGIRR